MTIEPEPPRAGAPEPAPPGPSEPQAAGAPGRPATSTTLPRPLLVLVHGTRMNRHQWDGYDALVPGAELRIVELPGHGDRAGEEFTREAALAVVGEAVASAAPWRPVILAGHSLGGYLVTDWAATHPGVLDALVLLGATGDPGGRLTFVYRGFAGLVPRVGPERLSRAMNTVMRRLGAGEATLPDGTGYAALPAAWAYVIDSCGPVMLEAVDCPVVIANGQLDQMRLHVRRYATAARTDPARHVEIHQIPLATHLFPTTHREQVARVLRSAVEIGRQHVVSRRPAAPPTMDR